MSWSWDLPITWSRHVTTHMINSHDPDTRPTNFILTSSHHQYYHPRHHFYIMTTSGSLIRHITTTSSHHHGTRRLSSKDLMWASSRMLWRPARKTILRSTPVLESGGSGWIEGKYPRSLQRELDQGEVPSIASKKTTKRATSEIVREDGWPDAAWPNLLGRQRHLQPWNTILLDELGWRRSSYQGCSLDDKAE